MCIDCWQEAGCPTIRSEAIDRAVRAVHDLYEEHGTGGSLHIVTDDYNAADSYLAFCVQWAKENGGGFDALERAAYDALLPLTEEERISALALHDGLWANVTTPH